MSVWTHDLNCFMVRFAVDPAKRERFEQAVRELLVFAEPFAERGCRFAFHGWARDPNEWVVIAAWQADVFQELAAAPESQRTNGIMRECTTMPVTVEFFAGMKTDRSIFDIYPERPASLQVGESAQ